MRECKGNPQGTYHQFIEVVERMAMIRDKECAVLAGFITHTAYNHALQLQSQQDYLRVMNYVGFVGWATMGLYLKDIHLHRSRLRRMLLSQARYTGSDTHRNTDPLISISFTESYWYNRDDLHVEKPSDDEFRLPRYLALGCAKHGGMMSTHLMKLRFVDAILYWEREGVPDPQPFMDRYQFLT